MAGDDPKKPDASTPASLTGPAGAVSWEVQREAMRLDFFAKRQAEGLETPEIKKLWDNIDFFLKRFENRNKAVLEAFGAAPTELRTKRVEIQYKALEYIGSVLKQATEHGNELQKNNTHAIITNWLSNQQKGVDHWFATATSIQDVQRAVLAFAGGLATIMQLIPGYQDKGKMLEALILPMQQDLMKYSLDRKKDMEAMTFGLTDDQVRKIVHNQAIGGAVQADTSRLQPFAKNVPYGMDVKQILDMLTEFMDPNARTTRDLGSIRALTAPRAGNNPFNMRPEGGSGFMGYATLQEGYEAGIRDLTVKLSGKSGEMERRYGKNYVPTIENVISTWAPPTDGNNTAVYIARVAAESGIDPKTPLTVADIPKLVGPMIRTEGTFSVQELKASGVTLPTEAFNPVRTLTPAEIAALTKADPTRTASAAPKADNIRRTEDSPNGGARARGAEPPRKGDGFKVSAVAEQHFPPPVDQPRGTAQRDVKQDVALAIVSEEQRLKSAANARTNVPVEVDKRVVAQSLDFNMQG